MAIFSLTASAAEALVLGLATGPVCLASCGPVVVPWMLVQPRGLRTHARQLAVFLAARLAGYLGFATAIWFAASILSASWRPRPWIFGGVELLLAAGLLVYAAGWPHSSCAATRLSRKRAPALVQIGGFPEDHVRPLGAVALGFLTGINLCPPFLVAGMRATQLPTLTAALLFFTVFFAGTAVWFMPFLSFCVIRRTPSFLTVARMAAVLLACWYTFAGASTLIERALYG